MKLAPIAAVLCVASLALAGPAAANTFNVTKTADTQDGSCSPSDCSLREAVDAAASNSEGDTINVPAGHYTLSIDEIEVDDDLTIVGASARTTIIDGAGIPPGPNARVLDIESGTTHISHLTITGGVAAQGGGIFNESTLFVDSSAVEGNKAVGDQTFGGQGGGIFNNNEITVTNSSVSRNIADGAGNSFSGGQGGGIFNNDQGDYTNVTISDNQAKPATGAIFPDGQGGGIFTNDVTSFKNVTIAGNVSSGAADNAAGGVFINDQTTFKNTIIAGNTVSGVENDCVVNDTVVDQGHNLEGANDCGLTGTGDQHNANPLLGALANNGGESDTRALLTGSPAIDTADSNGCPATDQRGVTRPQLTGCDIGAYEAAPAPATTPPPASTPPAKDSIKPKLSVAGVRRACISHSFSIVVRASDVSGVKSVRVTLDGKKLKTTSKTKFKLRINARRLKAGRHVLRIVTTDNAGNRSTARRTIARCAKAPKPRHRAAPRFTG